MTDRELLDHIRRITGELDLLIHAAERNSKYRTAGVLRDARGIVADAEAGLVWHVEG